MSSTNSSPPPPYDGHKSRRDNQSVASTHSSASSSSRPSRSGHPAVESAVTRLLVAIKQLLESLTQWSNLQMTEAQISDVYVPVAAFAVFNIDMSDLMSIPEDLREVLETCLAEDANPDNLAIYLPKVRGIITRLLQGLRSKQSRYREIVSEQQGRHRSGVSHSRTDSRSSKSDRTSSKRGDEGRHRSHLSRSNVDEERNAERDRTPAARQSARPSTSTKPPETHPHMAPPPVFQEPDDDPPANDRTLTSSTNEHFEGISRPPHPQPRNSQPAQPPRHPSYEDGLTNAPNETVVGSQRNQRMPHPAPELDKEMPQTPPAQVVPVPPSVKRYSLVDKPVLSSPTSPPAVIIEEPSIDRDDINGADLSPPQTPASISGSPNRRSMAASSSLTPGDLAILTEVDEPEVKRNDSTPKKVPRTPSTAGVGSAPPVPPLPPSSMNRTPSNRSKLAEHVEAPEPTQQTSFSVFLQVGREVKKVTIEPGLNIATLRMFFVDKTSQPIYIRDPSSGVQYELEDIEEVKEKCLLSLNIEPLDQIKQHIDTQISTLSNDLKELRTAIASNRRSSSHFSPILAHEFVESTPIADRPSDRQFAHVARRLSRIVGDAHSGSNPFIQPQMTGQSLQLQPQMTGASSTSEYSSRVVNDLKTQFDEVQNLRRDLGIMKQLYTDFMKSTKESLGALRTQTQSVKQLANAKVGGARGYIDVGKTKLDTRSQNVLTKVEELQDTVEALKEDVIKRHVTPKPQVLKTIQDDITSTATELSSLKEHMDTIRPMWKKTWEEELQNIVEEQGFLGHQEELLADLLEDHKALIEVYGHVQKVISLRGTTPSRGGRGRSFKPVPPEEGQTDLSTVLMEIRGAAVDPEKRMKAIAANQKNRERELANRSDEFQNELSGFVNGKKLKLTGGAEEVERVRQKRNELALKAMFNASAGVGELTSQAPRSTSPKSE
ncbi:actin interacting protein 3-domain-containing protein [Melanogaster broomeanus]|nr:actin interacting protein 3-domain-containing protein [Melanogaster broomeanus]